MRLPIFSATLLSLALLTVGSAYAQPEMPASEAPATESPKTADKPKAGKPADEDNPTPTAKELRTTTQHTVVIDGRTIAYKATAGTLTIRDDKEKATASMFYVAYVVDQDKASTVRRPVTFFYNGGPGSATVWLHLGSFGPVRVHTDSPEPTHNAPFEVGPNNESLLDRSDLVFLDAIGAGFSRPLGDTKGEAFWGVDQDVDAFARGITRYVNLYERWNSPKFLFGESYGTTRSAALVHKLQDEGMQINGVMLLSTILNYGIRTPGFDRIFIGYLPTFAAAAWYHNKIPNKPADLPAYLQEVRAWAAGPYATALEKGQDLTAAETDSIAGQLHAYTGLSVQFIKENHLRVSLSRFRKELLREEHRTIGRYDSRFEGIDTDDAGENPEFDASSTGVSGAFIAALHSYLQQDLNFGLEITYFPSGPDINRRWDWHHKAPGATEPYPLPDVAQDLGAAMRENPHLKILSLNGWYDMATPFFETEFDLKHLELDASIRNNLSFSYYPSGHMVYLNPEALKQMKKDVGSFYDAVAR